jgi:hypothetical protein
LCGIGGGVFAVPLLHYAYGMPLKIAIANSLVLVAASTSVTEGAVANSTDERSSATLAHHVPRYLSRVVLPRFIAS